MRKQHNTTTTNISQYLNPNQQVSSQMRTYSKYHPPNPHSRHTPEWYRKHHHPNDPQEEPEPEPVFVKSALPGASEQKKHLNSTTMDQSYSRFEGRRSDKDHQRELFDAIGKLKEVKYSLEKEIGLLQSLLDESSRHIDQMDAEYEKIKGRLMEYLSQSLDTAFRDYRARMPRWSQYEEVERKGLEVVVELDRYINEEQEILNTLRGGGVSSERDREKWDEHLAETNNRTTHYGYMAKEVARSREECIMRHPSLREDRLEQFEAAVGELCQF